jgi:hypothetical protein
VKEYNVKLKTILKSSVATAAILAVAAPVISSQAEAGIKNGNDNALTVSGHINRSILLLDDGSHEKMMHVDGGTANSRMRFVVSGSISDQVAVGGLYEMNMANLSGGWDNITASTDGNDRMTTNDAAFAVRRAEISFNHATAGKLTIGQTNMADNSAVSAWGGGNHSTGGASAMSGTQFIDTTAPLTDTAITVAGQLGIYDAGRGQGVRYDLPSGMPVAVAVMAEEEGAWSAGGGWSGEFGGIGVKIGVGYNNVSSNSTTIENTMFGTIALNHSSGLGLMLGHGEEDSKAGQGFSGEGQAINVSYQSSDISALGSTHIRFGYTQNEDSSQAGDEANITKVQFVQNLPAGTQVHIGWEEAEYERLATKTYGDVSTFMAGVQISF